MLFIDSLTNIVHNNRILRCLSEANSLYPSLVNPYKHEKPAKAASMETQPTLTFPVIRGLQARREYYVAMWTLRMLRQISIFDEDELPPELRAQRTINKARIPEIAATFWTTRTTTSSRRSRSRSTPMLLSTRCQGRTSLGCFACRWMPDSSSTTGSTGAPRSSRHLNNARAWPRNDRRRVLPRHRAGALPADVCRPQPSCHSSQPLARPALRPP